MPPVEISARHRIGRQIAYHRHRAGLTVEELAARTGLHPSNVAKIEAGRYNATVGIIDTIATALGVELAVGLA